MALIYCYTHLHRYYAQVNWNLSNLANYVGETSQKKRKNDKITDCWKLNFLYCTRTNTNGKDNGYGDGNWRTETQRSITTKLKAAIGKVQSSCFTFFQNVSMVSYPKRERWRLKERERDTHTHTHTSAQALKQKRKRGNYRECSSITHTHTRICLLFLVISFDEDEGARFSASVSVSVERVVNWMPFQGLAGCVCVCV